VNRQRVCTDDQESDVSGDERSQQIDKIRIHRDRRREAAIALVCSRTFCKGLLFLTWA
jgi:hypothetical protein